MEAPAAAAAVRTAGGDGPSSRSPPGTCSQPQATTAGRRRLRKALALTGNLRQAHRKQLCLVSRAAGCDGRSRAVGWGRRGGQARPATATQQLPPAMVGDKPALKRHKASAQAGRQWSATQAGTCCPAGQGALLLRAMYCRQLMVSPPLPLEQGNRFQFGTDGWRGILGVGHHHRAPAAGWRRCARELEHSRPKASRVGRW